MFNRIEISLQIKKLENWRNDFSEYINLPSINLSNSDLFYAAGKKEQNGILNSKEHKEINRLTIESYVNGILSKELIFTMGYEYIISFYSIIDNAFKSISNLQNHIIEIIDLNNIEFDKNVINELFAIRHSIAHSNGYITHLYSKNKNIINEVIERRKDITLCSNDRIYLTKNYLKSVGENILKLMIELVNLGILKEISLDDFIKRQEKIRKEIYEVNALYNK